eukprot:GDKJ01012305.1.p3 GENE.GDKJ01012305.1~~GDKJ01012305.1.p3  ORF type:complete len:110 (+),score=12.60 GDKJ01012305.1:208-537(+)
MGLFSKKPGGTFFGNLLRGVGSVVSQNIGMPGLLGSGANKIEFGQTKTNAQLAAEAGQQQSAAQSYGSNVANTLMGTGSNPNMLYVWLAAAFGLLILFKDKIFGGKKSY